MDSNKQPSTSEEAKKPTYIENQTNQNCQQFFGTINGGIFAMPGSNVTQNVNGQAVDTHETESAATTAKEDEGQMETDELRDGTIDEHRLAYKDAMLKVQECVYSKLPFEGMIKNSYDWFAVMRLAVDIGIFSDGWSGITTLFGTDTETRQKFREVPKDYRNFSAYTKYISKDYKYPNWQCAEKEQSYFRKFLAIANVTYTLYKNICKKQKIKPYE